MERARQPGASWVTCCPVSLTDVPCPCCVGTRGTNPHSGGRTWISAGKIRRHICQPLGSLGEACATELGRPLLSPGTRGTPGGAGQRWRDLNCPVPPEPSRRGPLGPLFAFTPLTQFPAHRVSWAVDLNPQGAGLLHALERMKAQVRHSPVRPCSKYWPKSPHSTFVVITISRACTAGWGQFQVFYVY